MMALSPQAAAALARALIALKEHTAEELDDPNADITVPVNSSFINTITWAPPGTIIVDMKRGTWEYPGTFELFKEFVNAGSHGEFFNQYIRPLG